MGWTLEGMDSQRELPTNINTRSRILKLVNVSDRDVGPDTISDTFRARTLHHPCPLKME